MEDVQSRRGQVDIKSEIKEEAPKQEESSPPCEVIKEEPDLIKQEHLDETTEVKLY